MTEAGVCYCAGCGESFPEDEPMLALSDDGEFCSYDCIVAWLAEGARDHCRTHADLIEAHASFQSRVMAMMEEVLRGEFIKRDGTKGSHYQSQPHEKEAE